MTNVTIGLVGVSRDWKDQCFHKMDLQKLKSNPYLQLLAVSLVLIGIVFGLTLFPSDPVQDQHLQPIQIQSGIWGIRKDVEVMLIADPSYGGKDIALTLLAPGPGQLNISDPAFDNKLGIAGVQLTWLSPDQQETEIKLAAATGARYVGLDFDWRQIELVPGHYNWTELDQIFALAKQHNLFLVPMLVFTPQWASQGAYAPLDYHRAPPKNVQDFRDFVYEVVNRYKPYGVSPLTSDGYGIKDWVIWNEPNTHTSGVAPNPGKFWIASIEEYIELLRAGYEGAHAADPNSNVLNGAITDVFWTGDQSDISSGIERFYDPNGDGDASDGGRPFFDTLNIHLYQLDKPQAKWYQERLDKITAIMQRFGDDQKPIWITETGYGSISSPLSAVRQDSTGYVSEEEQANAISLVFETALSYPQVERVFWWSLRDYFSDSSANNEAMEAHFGLLHVNFAPKPSFISYAQFTGHGGSTLTLSAVLDENGIASIKIPASFIDQEGTYILFAQLDANTPVTVATYQVVSEGEID